MPNLDENKKITENIYLNDNTKGIIKGHSGFDKLYKVKPLYDLLKRHWAEVYIPSSQFVIDDSMIRFKGISGIKQYMSLKPIKRGSKVGAQLIRQLEI